VTAVVPERERSTASHALTLHKPLRVHEVASGLYALSGTPSDCARFGILHLLRARADLLVSGINHGYNLGEDILYSGTVGAAFEGALNGIPSLAVSQESGPEAHFPAAARIAGRVAGRLLEEGAPAACLNLNVPDLPYARIRGLKVTTLGRRLYSKRIDMRRDPRGHRYFWMMGKGVSGIAHPGSDIDAVEHGYASLTPLLTDLTDAKSIEAMRKWRI
jgi:5'-nucleotidase